MLQLRSTAVALEATALTLAIVAVPRVAALTVA